MKNNLRILLLASLSLGLSACVSTMPGGVTSNNGPTTLVGEASCFQILTFITLGDCGYEAAKKNGNITNVHHTDRNVTNYFIVAKVKTQVYGNSK